MLAAALILAGLFGAPKDTHPPSAAATCPATPEAAFVVGATTCPALEVSGFAGASGASLDPAFDVSIPPAEFARPVQTAGAFLAGYAADGRRLFTLPIEANGAFHIYVPLADVAERNLARLEISTASAHAERIANPPADAVAEIISLDEGKAIVAWTARAFPSIRVKESPAVDRARTNRCRSIRTHGSSTSNSPTAFTARRASFRSSGANRRDSSATYFARKRDPGSVIASPRAHCGQSAGSYDTTGRSSSAIVGTPKSDG